MTKTTLLIAGAAILALGAARADVIEKGVKDAALSGLLAGVARADITPPVGIAHLNWGSQTHVVAAGVDPVGMCATALALSDGKQKFAMVDIDALTVDGMEDVARRASALTGIPELHIRLAATHTHSAPNISAAKGPAGVDLTPHQKMLERYRMALADKVVGAIVEANGLLQPVHLYGDRGLGRININRRVRAKGDMPAAVGRNTEGFTDRELVVIRIDDAEGRPLAILANYQCHGTVLAYENQLLSPDWIGAMRRVVEQAMPGAKCLFFRGAAGNQGPIEGFTGDVSVAHRLGTMLGHEVAAVAFGVETVKREPRFEGFVESTAYQARQHWRVLGPRGATLKFATRVLELPPRRYTPREIDEMETLVADAQRKLQAPQVSVDPWKKHQAEARLRRFADLLTDWRRAPTQAPVKVRVQILRIGDVAIVAMPGEPFAEIGAAIKKASPFPVTMFCGYSSGEGGDYMPIEPEYKLGGYEVQRTPYGTGAAEKLIRETVALFGEVQ